MIPDGTSNKTMITDGTSNTILTQKLMSRGVSAQGTAQLLAGQIVSALADRLQITQFIHAEKNQDIEVENDETHWVGHDKISKVTFGGSLAEMLRKAGISAAGVQQILSSQPVTDAKDRLFLVKVVAALTGDGQILGNLV